VTRVTDHHIANPTSTAKTVVLGVGNLLFSDEGVGVHVVKRLSEMSLPPEVEVVEGGGGAPDMPQQP
jgi:hydrogenase maturation protease